MALITAGYWQNTYWVEGYWSLDYWGETPQTVPASAMLLAGYWPTTYWVASHWNVYYWPGYAVVIEPVGGPGLRPRRRKRLPKDWWFPRKGRRGPTIDEQIEEAKERQRRYERLIARRAEALYDHHRLKVAEENIDKRLEQEAKIARILDGKRPPARVVSIKKQRLLNLERATMAKEKKKRRAEEINAGRLESLAKARKAGERKRRKKKKREEELKARRLANLKKARRAKERKRKKTRK